MNSEKLIFQSLENKEIFKTQNLINKEINFENYEEIFKNKNLKKVLTNQSLNESVDAFVEGNLNLTIASKNSYVHRNTLIYRICKIKKLIGLDLRNFNDCVIYLNARHIFRSEFN